MTKNRLAAACMAGAVSLTMIPLAFAAGQATDARSRAVTQAAGTSLNVTPEWWSQHCSLVFQSVLCQRMSEAPGTLTPGEEQELAEMLDAMIVMMDRVMTRLDGGTGESSGQVQGFEEYPWMTDGTDSMGSTLTEPKTQPSVTPGETRADLSRAAWEECEHRHPRTRTQCIDAFMAKHAAPDTTTEVQGFYEFRDDSLDGTGAGDGEMNPAGLRS